MRVERRDHRKRADLARRVAQWISGAPSVVGEVPPYTATPDAGRRILKRLALRGLIRRVEWGWVAGSPLIRPTPLRRVDPDES
jgi:hypothetical protein